MRRYGWMGVVAMLAALTAGCGERKTTASSLPNGQATGPAYRFTLPESWKALNLGEKADRAIAGSITDTLPSLDLNGVTISYWAKPDDDKNRTIVNVATEPITRDTSTALIAASSDNLLRAITRHVEDAPLPPPATFGGTPTHSVRYRRGEFAHRAVLTRHGDYAYTLTVTNTRGHAADQDKLVEQIARSWRWTPLGAAGAKQTAGIHDLVGTGYTVQLAPGWRGTRKSSLKGRPTGDADSLWRGHIDVRMSSNVTVARLEQVDGGLDDLADQVMAGERTSARQSKGRYEIDSLTRGARTEIDGEPAIAIEIRSKLNKLALGQRELVVRRGKTIYRMVLTAEAARYAQDSDTFATMLKTWKWTAP